MTKNIKTKISSAGCKNDLTVNVKQSTKRKKQL